MMTDNIYNIIVLAYNNMPGIAFSELGDVTKYKRWIVALYNSRVRAESQWVAVGRMQWAEPR